MRRAVETRRRERAHASRAARLMTALALGVLCPLTAAAQSAQPGNAAAAGQEKPGVTEKMDMKSEKDVGYGADTSFLTWHGYLSMEGFKQDDKIGTFDLHEFYLSAKAQVSSKVSVTAEFEYEHAPEKLILPIQAYVDYAAHPAFIVRAGTFFAPIGIPRTYTLRGNKNRLVRQVALTHDLMFENWVEMGVNVFGQFKNGFFYDTSVSNGMPNSMATGDSWFDAVNGLQSHTEDNNNNKALIGRAGYAKSNDRGDLNVAVSGATQKYDPASTKTMTHVAIDGRYQHRSGFRFQGEWMQRGGDDNPADLANGIAAEADGWYAQVSQRMLVKGGKAFWEPVLQIDGIDLNKHTDTNKDLVTTAIGFNFSPESHFVVKSEYDFVKESHGAKVKNNKLWFGLVAEF